MHGLFDGTVDVHHVRLIISRGETEARNSKVGLLRAGIVCEDTEVVLAAEADAQELELFRDALVILCHCSFLSFYKCGVLSCYSMAGASRLGSSDVRSAERLSAASRELSASSLRVTRSSLALR